MEYYMYFGYFQLIVDLQPGEFYLYRDKSIIVFIFKLILCYVLNCKQFTTVPVYLYSNLYYVMF